MVDALVVGLPFEDDARINVIDVGCGTGTIAKRIKGRYHNARITCLDFADNMLQMAGGKLGNGPGLKYVLADIRTYDFDRAYDVVASSLALHHLPTDEDKKTFYTKVSRALRPGGFFYNADVVLGQSDAWQHSYMEKWKEFMRRSVDDAEIENKWIPSYENEDRPARLVDQIEWLKNIGLSDVDVLWKYYNFAVYGGRRPSTE